MSTPQGKILDHLNILPAARDADWEQTFLHLFPMINVTIARPDPQTGPDNWPYLFVEVTDSSEEPVLRVIEWLSERGIGLAINPQKAIPDFVLTYGMLCNYRMSGYLITDQSDFGPKEIQAENNQIFVAEPNEHYLPSYLREIIRNFFKDQKISKPRLTLISQDQKLYDLAFSLESLGSPPEHEHTGICEALSWFLPAHYGIVLVSEKRISGFVDL